MSALDVSVKLDTKEFEQRLLDLANSSKPASVKNALRAAVTTSARRAARAALPKIVRDLNVDDKRAALVSNAWDYRRNPQVLKVPRQNDDAVAEWTLEAKGPLKRIGIWQLNDSVQPVRTGYRSGTPATATSFVLSGSYPLNVPKSFVMTVNGNRFVVVREGHGKHAKLKGVYLGTALVGFKHKHTPRTVWRDEAGKQLNELLAKNIQKAFDKIAPQAEQ